MCSRLELDTDTQPFEWPTGRTWLYLTLLALVGTVLSELIWLRATLMTTPVISTVAVSISIPLAIVADRVLDLRQVVLSCSTPPLTTLHTLGQSRSPVSTVMFSIGSFLVLSVLAVSYLPHTLVSFSAGKLNPALNPSH